MNGVGGGAAKESLSVTTGIEPPQEQAVSGEPEKVFFSLGNLIEPVRPVLTR